MSEIASSADSASGRFGVTIGEMCDLLGLTRRAVRYYEERGLITSGRDRQNRRIYDLAARRRLEMTADLRRAGVPLAEILSLLHEGQTDETVLRRQVLEKLSGRLEALDRAREELMQVISTFGAASGPGEETRTASGRRLLAKNFDADW